MTTEDIVDVDNVEEVKKPRDLGVLLKLDTYQGMTDEEIESVFEFKFVERMNDVKVKIMYNQSEQLTNEQLATNKRCLQMAEQQLELIKSNTFVPKRVKDNG